MARRRTRVVALVAGLAVLAGALVAVAGGLLIAPHRAEVGPPPEGLPAETIRFASGSGATLAAWAVDAESAMGTVVVLHGVRANRGAVANRVALFAHAGFDVLAPDLQAHGESTGDAITFGHLERHDAIAAVRVARERWPDQPVAVVGVSLGGAAAALAGADLGADAVVLEAVYADIESATRNRLRLRAGALGAALAPVLLAQLPLRLGISAGGLRPVDTVGDLGVPVLVVAGAEDARTTPADTERLLAAVAHPEVPWIVSGAAHVDVLEHDPDGYGTHVFAFVDDALGAARR